MDISGEYRVPATRPSVWQALHDPDVLRQAIPGCQNVTPRPQGRLEAQVVVASGDDQYMGMVTFSALGPPHVYVLSVECVGGSGQIRLRQDGDFTILAFDARVLVEHGYLLEERIRKMADDFVNELSRQITQAQANETAPVIKGRGLAPAVWVSGLIGIGLGVLWFLSR